VGLVPEVKTAGEITVDLGQPGQSGWKAYVVRFAFGGAVTASAGLIAQVYGPVVGGLFLAFPAILPASITLIESHDGGRAARAGALGAAIGSLGLMAFGALVWGLGLHLSAWQVLAGSALIWLVVSALLWGMFEWARRSRQQAQRNGPNPG
jgi:hypothetical protein